MPFHYLIAVFLLWTGGVGNTPSPGIRRKILPSQVTPRATSPIPQKKLTKPQPFTPSNSQHLRPHTPVLSLSDSSPASSPSSSSLRSEEGGGGGGSGGHLVTTSSSSLASSSVSSSVQDQQSSPRAERSSRTSDEIKNVLPDREPRYV